MIQCRILKLQDCHSDHEPIWTIINLSTIQASQQRVSKNSKQTDTKQLREKLRTYFTASTHLPVSAITPPVTLSIEIIDMYVEHLIKGIQEAILHATPFYNITPKSRPGFTKECKKAQQNAKQLKEKVTNRRGMESISRST